MSPVLLAGLALRPVPPKVFQPILGLVSGALHRRHAEVFERLEPLADALFLIDPLDLPVNFLLRPGRRPPSLTIVQDQAPAPKATATIRGPLLSLIELLEGRADGDALFFSRDLTFEGDTEAVLTLRNAIDGADIDLVEIMAAPFGPLSGVVRRLAGPIDGLLRRLTRDLGALQAAVIDPATRRVDAQAAELDELRRKVAELERRARAGRARGVPAQ